MDQVMNRVGSLIISTHSRVNQWRRTSGDPKESSSSSETMSNSSLQVDRIWRFRCIATNNHGPSLSGDGGHLGFRWWRGFRHLGGGCGSRRGRGDFEVGARHVYLNLVKRGEYCILMGDVYFTRLIEQERYMRIEYNQSNHSYSLTSPHSRWRCLTRGGGYLTSPLKAIV